MSECSPANRDVSWFKPLGDTLVALDAARVIEVSTRGTHLILLLWLAEKGMATKLSSAGFATERLSVVRVFRRFGGGRAWDHSESSRTWFGGAWDQSESSRRGLGICMFSRPEHEQHHAFWTPRSGRVRYSLL